MTTTTPTTPKGAITAYYDHAQASKDLREYDPDIQIEFLRQCGLYAYYNVLLVKAELQASKLSHRLEVIEAELSKELRAAARAKGDKITEGQIRELVTLDRRVRLLNEALLEAKAQVGFLKGTVTAMSHRKDMLQQMGFAARKEMDSSSGNMVVMKQSMREVQDARLTRLKNLDVELPDLE